MYLLVGLWEISPAAVRASEGPTMSEKFTTEQLNELRTGYGTIKSIDPCQPTYARLVATLDGMSQA